MIYLNFESKFMKIVNSFFQVVLSLTIVGFLIYFLTGYDSAFEADQSCHAYLANIDSQLGTYGCDHDTETHQWILYDEQNINEPAKIVKKFRYKFL